MDLLDQFTTVNQVQREKTILEILSMLMTQKNNSGKRYTIRQACQEAGISPATWDRWVQDGLVSGPLQKFSLQLRQTVYDNIIPHYSEIIQNLVSIALGKPPEGTTMTITAGDMRGAIQDLFKIIPPGSLDKLATGATSEGEHIDAYQPKQIFVNIQNGDFVYKGGDNFSLGSGPEEDGLVIDHPQD